MHTNGNTQYVTFDARTCMEPLFLGGVGAIKKMGFTSLVDGFSIKVIINSEPVQF